MLEYIEIHIPAKNVQSLCWEGDSLVDWVAGERHYYLDGTEQRRRVSYSFTFDQAVNSPSGDYAVIYVKYGTKGLVLHKGKILREINRSFYQANVYEYPVTLLQLKNGQEIIAHCPERYNRLELDDLATGKRLTDAPDRKPKDYFFSRLSANESGTYLLSAGWHWQPMDYVRIFNINQGLEQPSHFDKWGIEFNTSGDNSSACFVENDHFISSLWDDKFRQTEQSEESVSEEKDPPWGMLLLFSILENKFVSSVSPSEITGTIMPIG